jgi:dihydrofolate synthase/folylpolyglutamate synthase
VDERGGTLHVCLNAVEGKGLPNIAEMLADRGAHAIPFPMNTERALPPDEIADTLRSHGVPTRDPQSLADTLDSFQRSAAPADGLLCVGTHKVMEVLPDWARQAPPPHA